MTTYIKQRLGIAYSCEGGWKVTRLQLRKFRLLKGKFFVCLKKKKTQKTKPELESEEQRSPGRVWIPHRLVGPLSLTAPLCIPAA